MWLLLLGVLWLVVGVEAWAQPAVKPGQGPFVIERIEFCDATTGPFETVGCHWQVVQLPHRWEPRGDQGDGPAWGLYRVTLARPGLPVIGVLTTRLSLHGQVRVGGQTIVPASAEGFDLAHLRYWPQLYLVPTTNAAPGEPMHIEIAVRGHVRAKNGLGSLAVASPSRAQALHERETLFEAIAMLAMAAATAMGGGLGLAVRDRRSLAGRLMRVVSWIAVLAAFRMVANYVTHPPLPWPAWNAINLLLLAGIAACVCLTMAIYLDPSRQGRWRWLVSSLGVLLVGLVALPAAWMFRWAEGWFGAVTVFGAVLFGRMVWRVVRTGDSLGWIIVAPVLGIVALGAHDLVLHLSRHSMSDDYLQRWSVPGLLVLMIVLLARRVAAQRTTEAALAAETMRREELLRDLHDGVGSRLVALSLHARWSGGDPQLAEEIDGLLRELQLIQSTVRAAPTTLQSLVADLRHLYSRLGGGAIPIHWPLADLPLAVPLSAEQAVAVVRIAEEAVANAMKHAHPTRIEIGCCTAPAPWQAILTIGDDGVGQFQPDEGQGLNNMRTRAERAGLGLVLLPAQPQDPLKKVQLLIPRPGSLDDAPSPSPWRGGWRAVIAGWWRRTGA